MGLLLPLGIFAVSLAVLILAARFFTKSAEIIGLALGMSPFVIGVLIVSVGTSLPELIASIVAVQGGSSEIVMGNVLGSSLSNIFFVLGMTALFARGQINLGDQYIAIDLHFLLGAVFATTLIAYDGQVTASEGIFVLLVYVAYVFYLLKEGATAKDVLLDDDLTNTPKKSIAFKDVGIVVLSGVFIYLGAKYTISSLEQIAAALNVSKAVVSVTLLSVGTTLPECVVSVVAAREGKGDIAVGNILGSCIFNALMVLGVTSLFGGLTVPPDILRLPLPVYIAAAILFYLLTQDKKLSKWEGALILLLYALFMGKVANIL
jgi:cation:H+ antiporter